MFSFRNNYRRRNEINWNSKRLYQIKKGGKSIKKLYKREVFKSQEEWLAARGLGGTSCAVIFGKSPWKSRLELYKDCIGINKSKKKISNDSMKLGTKLEPLIRNQIALDFPNLKVHSPKNFEMYRSKDKPYQTATVDGLAFDKTSHKRFIIEIKTHDIRNAQDSEEWANGIPEHYFLQVIHYLNVLNDYDGVLFVSRLRYFDYYNENGKKLEKVETTYRWIYREDSAIQAWIQAVDKEEIDFIENHVKKGIPPTINF